MKSYTVTTDQLLKLSDSLRSEILKLNESEKIKQLKQRVKSLSIKHIDYRTDVNKLERESKSPEIGILSFCVWVKTAGEEWGNCSGKSYGLKLGRKYARIEERDFATNRTTRYSEYEISLEEAENIIHFFERYIMEENETDKATILQDVGTLITYEEEYY